jgi:chromosome segregation ATPase
MFLTKSKVEAMIKKTYRRLLDDIDGVDTKVKTLTNSYSQMKELLQKTQQSLIDHIKESQDRFNSTSTSLSALAQRIEKLEALNKELVKGYNARGKHIEKLDQEITACTEIIEQLSKPKKKAKGSTLNGAKKTKSKKVSKRRTVRKTQRSSAVQ